MRMRRMQALKKNLVEIQFTSQRVVIFNFSFYTQFDEDAKLRSSVK